jgi:hypothetical protein
VELFYTLWQLVLDLGNLIVELLRLGLQWWLLIAWIAWWTFAVNWRTAWRWLGQGAWVPLVLLMLMAALVWSRLDARPLHLEDVRIANGWWQLAAVGAVTALTLLCGWIQGLINTEPAEVDLEPPAHVEPAHPHHH